MDTKVKISVLENVSDLDAPFAAYLNKLKNVDVTVVYSIQSKEKQIEVHQALSSCEVLCVCSTFANQDQLAQFVKLIPNYPNIKEVRILYLYSKPSPGDNRSFLFKLNLDIEKEVYKGVVGLLSKLKIVEVFHTGLVTQKQAYFDKVEYYFDEVELYYIPKKDLIWHVRPPYIVLDGEENYLDQVPTKVVTITQHTETDLTTLPGVYIKPIDLPILKPAMEEFRAMVDTQIESCKQHDFGDSKKLIAEKEEWLNLLDKYKL